MSIRPFHNADLPDLVEIWNQHWSAFGPSPMVSSARFEQAVLARTFFDPASLLVAESRDGLQGWCHFLPSSEAATTAVICAICVAAQAENSLSAELLQAAEREIAKLGFSRIQVGVVQDHQFGYLGLAPIGHGIGITELDQRTSGALESRGFAAEQQFDRMVATVTGYRAPINREAMQFRRMSKVETLPHQATGAMRAAALSHLDIETVRLIDRAGDQLAAVNLLLSDPEAEVMSPSMAILDLRPIVEKDGLQPSEAYLIGVVIESLAARHIDHLETAVDNSCNRLGELLISMGLRCVERGNRWAKSI